jgi:hypothetical protein
MEFPKLNEIHFGNFGMDDTDEAFFAVDFEEELNEVEMNNLNS